MALKWDPVNVKINEQPSLVIGQSGGGIAYSTGIVNIFGVDYVVRKNHDDSLPVVLYKVEKK